ncbi:MAG: hypothetical protein BGO21_02425 [Dyadobacter sp. 50-39]|uniref:hypothetical protein n=1 Tax=Dyadobacter sp. 50-39 TaxID=1895756 RepID=UPI000960C3B0|nr:hypothetical protein [Dyadobacter sp. 50-39]OJV12621.1 MAG: hypothetical protein BGO21_02425 [Dyadobacter sp. 50-39]
MKIGNSTKGIALTMTLLFMLSAQLVIAQDASVMQDKAPKERAKYQTEMMKNKLGLDSVQLNQVGAINLKYALKNEPVLKSDKSKLSKFKQLKSSQKEKDAELKKIFTPEQYRQFQDFQDEMKSQMKEKRKNR